MQFFLLSWEQLCKSSHRSPVSFPSPELRAGSPASVSHTIQFFSWKSPPLPSWGRSNGLSWKKRSVQHLGIVQVHTLIHSLFQNWSTHDYIPDASIPASSYPFPSHTSLSSLPITFILARPYCLIAPSGTWLLIFYLVYSWSKQWKKLSDLDGSTEHVVCAPLTKVTAWWTEEEWTEPTKSSCSQVCAAAPFL